MGVLEEGAKTVGGIVDAMRSNPLAIANILLNICFLVFLIYYVSIIASRAQNTVNALFAANDRIYAQWGTVIKDQNVLTEKAMHCLLPDDAIKLLQIPRPQPQKSQDPDWLAPLRAIPLRFGPAKPTPPAKLELPEVKAPLLLPPLEEKTTKPEDKEPK